MNTNPNNPDFDEFEGNNAEESLNNTARINIPDEYSESNTPGRDFDPTYDPDFAPNSSQGNNYRNYNGEGSGYNRNYNQGFNPNYNPNYNPNPYNRNNMYKRKGNTGLIVAISVMSVLAAVIIITIILFATNVISPGKPHSEQAVSNEVQEPSQQESTTPAQQSQPQPQPQPQKPAEQPVSVERTMFIGNCNVSVTLRAGPAASYPEITQVPLASEVYVIEYTNSDFALVTYNGSRGYIKRNYIVSSRPQVYDYNASDVQNFVHDSILCFVNGVNTGNYDYVYRYFSGSAADQEMKSVKSIHDSVSSEEIISLNCHSATRASATQVTVIRDSVIRVTYPDGTVKDISERYKYTVDISGGAYKIIGLNEA